MQHPVCMPYFYGKVGGFNFDYIYEVVYHTLGEFRGNNVVFAEPFEGTSDISLGAPDAHFYLYSDQKEQSFAWPMWIKMNQIVIGASKNIEAIKLLETEPTEQSRLDELKQLKGENYFIRGLLFFHAVNAFRTTILEQSLKKIRAYLWTRLEAADCYPEVV